MRFELTSSLSLLQGDSGFKGTSVRFPPPSLPSFPSLSSLSKLTHAPLPSFQIDQDKRFSDKEAKLLRTTKFPAEFSQKVDMRKVNLAVMRPWMVKEVTKLIGFEDEVVVEYAVSCSSYILSL